MTTDMSIDRKMDMTIKMGGAAGQGYRPFEIFQCVNPYKTSQMCPECNHTQRENRKGENFKCLKCGFSEQADYVGSLNIRDRFLTERYGACFQT